MFNIQGLHQYTIKLLVLLAIVMVSLQGVQPASAAQITLYDIQCRKVKVAGTTTAAAPYVMLRVVRADNLSHVLAEKAVQVLAVVGRPFTIAVHFPEQPAGTRMIIVVGEWDGQQFINPAVPFGQDCIPSGVSKLDQTFSSDSLGFTMRYPAQWAVDAQPEVIYFTSNESLGGDVEPIRYTVFASEQRNPNGLGFEALAKQELSPELQAAFTYTSQSIDTLTVYLTESLPSRSGMLTAFVTRDGSRYLRLAIMPYSTQAPFAEQQAYQDLFEEILASLTMK